MTGWTYVRGDHPAIIQGSTCVAFGGVHGEDRARAVLPMMTAGTSLEDLLDVVLQTGIGALPDFFVGRVENGTLTAMLRGAALLTIEDDRWRHSTVDGLDARTWREVAFDGVTRLAVCFDRQLVRADLRTIPDHERAVRPGALAISEIIFRRPEPPQRLMTITGAARERLSAETEDFPAHLFDDGDPISAPDRSATLASAAPPPPPPPPPTVPGIPDESSAEVSGIVCLVGHANSPTRATCTVCGVPLAGAQPSRVSRPGMGVLRLPDGRQLPITSQMILGRSPRAERSDGRAFPTLVKLDGASADVSRNHARLFVEGWNVVIEDLGSTNGTVILSMDGTVRRLRGGETALLSRGTVLDIGGVRILVEDVP